MISYTYYSTDGKVLDDASISSHNSIIIGDIHASAFKLIVILADHGIIDFTIISKLFPFYTELAKRPKNEDELISSISAIISEIKLVETNIMNIILLGDTVFDKGISDRLVVELILHLKKAGLHVETILSNHDFEYILYYYNLESPINIERNRSAFKHASSQLDLTHKEYIDYLSAQKFLLYLPDKEVMLTHTLLQSTESLEWAGFGNTLNNLRQCFDLDVDNFAAKINYCISRFIASLKRVEQLSTSQTQTITTINRCLWYVNKYSEGRFTNIFNVPIKTYIHGHYTYRKYDTVMENTDFTSINLNNHSFRSEAERIIDQQIHSVPLVLAYINSGS